MRLKKKLVKASDFLLLSLAAAAVGDVSYSKTKLRVNSRLSGSECKVYFALCRLGIIQPGQFNDFRFCSCSEKIDLALMYVQLLVYSPSLNLLNTLTELLYAASHSFRKRYEPKKVRS